MIILVIGVLNFLNLKASAKMDGVFVVFVVLVLLLFSVFGLLHFNAGNFSNFAPNGLNGIVGGSALLFFDYLGFTKITALGGEVKNPKRNIPLSIMFSIFIVIILYVLTSVSAISLGGSGIYNSPEPLAVAVKGFGGNAIILISIAAVIAMIQVMFTSIMGSSRVMLAMSGKKLLPRMLSETNGDGVPVHAVIITMLFSIILALTGNFVFVVSATSFSYLLFFMISGFAALKLKKKAFPKWVIVISILLSASLLFFLDLNAWIVSFFVVLLAVVYWIAGKPKQLNKFVF